MSPRALVAAGLLLVGGAASAQVPDEDDIQPPPVVAPALPAREEPPPAPAPVDAPPPMVLVPVEGGPPPGMLAATAPGHAVFRLSLGAGARTLYSVGFGGAQIGLYPGGEGPRGAWYFTADVFIGASSERLPTGQAQLGFLGEAKIGRLRVGGGGRVGVLLIRRITNGHIMSEWSTGPRFTLSYDLATFGATALLLGADVGVDFPTEQTVMLDCGLYLGLRL